MQIITDTYKYEHIMPVLKSLHWLPVKYRIQYKVALITYKYLIDKVARYFVDLVVPYILFKSKNKNDVIQYVVLSEHI